MSRLKRLIVEIHRRSLWQVLGIYVVGGWIAFQVAQTLTEGLGLPDWFPGFALGLLIVLLPVVLATAFVQEGVGGGAARREGAAVPGAEVSEAAPSPEVPGRERGGVHHRVFTWRNAIVAGLSMLALLAVSAGGYMGLRAAGIGPFGTLMSKGLLEERDRIVLADFENHTADSLLGMAATDLFRTALSESGVVSVLSTREVNQVLVRMRREPGTALDAELASEVALREGLKAIVVGEIVSVGSAYVISARLATAEAGEELWAGSETAADSTEVIPAIDRLSRNLREQIGESLKSIRASEPLYRHTSSSLEAVKKYMQGNRAFWSGDYRKAALLYQEATRLDTLYATAYMALGLAHAWSGESRSVWAAELTRAFELRNPARGYFLAAIYYSYVTGDVENAALAYRAFLDLAPNSSPAHGNLAGIYLNRLRKYEEAEELLERAIELDSTAALNWVFLVAAQVALGKDYEAGVTLEQLASRFPDHPQRRSAGSEFAAMHGKYDEAEAQIAALRDRYKENTDTQVRTSEAFATFATLRGRLAEAERHLADALTTQQAQNWAAGYLLNSMVQGLRDSWFKADTAGALRRVATALERYPLDSVPLEDRPYNELVDFYARTGQAEEARAYLAQFEEQAEYNNRAIRMQRHYSLGHLAMSEARPTDAIIEYRRADGLDGVPVRALGLLAFAYDQAGERDSALAVYEQYVRTPWLLRSGEDSWWLAFTYERLGALYEQRGNSEKAVYYYGKFVDLWKDADPELQPRVEAARRAIEALSPDT